METILDEDEELTEDNITRCDIILKKAAGNTSLKTGKEEDELDETPYTKEEILDMMRNGTFSFRLPDGVEFDALKDLDEDDSLPF